MLNQLKLQAETLIRKFGAYFMEMSDQSLGLHRSQAIDKVLNACRKCLPGIVIGVELLPYFCHSLQQLVQ